MKKFNFIIPVLYLYSFILIYMPDLSYYIGISGEPILVASTLILFATMIISKKENLKHTLQNIVILSFIFLNVLFTLYYVIRTGMAGTSLSDVYNLRIVQNMIPVLIIIGVCCVFVKLDEFGYDKKKKYKFIINVGLIQSIIAISMVFIPQFRQIAYNIFYSGSDEINIYIYTSRLYGICDGNYTYSFQILHSFLALFALNYAYFFKEKRCYLYSVLLIIVSILNGRTGLIIYILGIVVTLIYILVKEQKILSFFRLLTVILVFFIVVLFIIKNFMPSTLKIINHAVEDILSFASGTDESSNETAHLLGSIQVPKGILNNIFGAGYRIYAGLGINYGYYSTSDIGFVNDWFMGGLFSIILLYGSFFILIKNIKKYSEKLSFENHMSIVLILCMLISNLKGEMFRSEIQIATLLFIFTFLFLSLINDIKKNIQVREELKK